MGVYDGGGSGGKMDGESKREELDDLITELTEELAMPELKD